MEQGETGGNQTKHTGEDVEGGEIGVTCAWREWTEDDRVWRYNIYSDVSIGKETCGYEEKWDEDMRMERCGAKVCGGIEPPSKDRDH